MILLNHRDLILFKWMDLDFEVLLKILEKQARKIAFQFQMNLIGCSESQNELFNACD